MALNQKEIKPIWQREMVAVACIIGMPYFGELLASGKGGIGVAGVAAVLFYVIFHLYFTYKKLYNEYIVLFHAQNTIKKLDGHLVSIRDSSSSEK
jgi:hypothetical protein